MGKTIKSNTISNVNNKNCKLKDDTTVILTCDVENGNASSDRSVLVNVCSKDRLGLTK